MHQSSAGFVGSFRLRCKLHSKFHIVVSTKNLIYLNFALGAAGCRPAPSPPTLLFTSFHLRVVKSKVHPCTITEALYRPYGP